MTLQAIPRRYALGYFLATHRCTAWNTRNAEAADVLAMFPPGLDSDRMASILEKMARSIRDQTDPNLQGRAIEVSIAWQR